MREANFIHDMRERWGETRLAFNIGGAPILAAAFGHHSIVVLDVVHDNAKIGVITDPSATDAYPNLYAAVTAIVEEHRRVEEDGYNPRHRRENQNAIPWPSNRKRPVA